MDSIGAGPAGNHRDQQLGRERERCMDVVGACRGFNPRKALVLRQEGQDLPRGWLAAGLALGLDGAPVLDWLLRHLREAGCTIIALDKQGKEVTRG